MFVLASKSPRRKELLAQLGINFSCYSADIDESVKVNELPRAYVERLAIEKAQAVAALPDFKGVNYILGSDTAVVIEGDILGKPIGRQDSHRMLKRLSGQTHTVLTSIAVLHDGRVYSEVIETSVTFKSLSDDEIYNYWLTGEPQDKAGSYGIQGIAGQFVCSINGSYSAVVGLPLYETANLLQKLGLNTIAKQECH